MPCSITKLLSGILPESLVNKYHETKKRKKSKRKKSKKYLSKRTNDPLKIFVHNILLKVLIIMLSGMTLFHRCKASLVLDKHAEDHIMFSKYCPSTPACPEGSHVMCMFFNPRSQYGPECIDPVNLEMTPEKANWLLDIFNAMRSKIARGEETGKGGMPLPRGYGLIRLQWDSELATFAQILADQCTENLYDQCRATERFKSPYQFVLGVQDRIDRWYEDKISTDKPWQSGKKLKEDKINEVIHMIFRHAYAMKNLVTPEEIVNPGKMKNHYINFVGGTSTHIGCAYILFSRYHPYNINNFEKMLQLICNLSASQEPGTSVYRTSPPGPDETELTKNCGCPPGYAEDSGCLCYAVDRTPVECRDNEKCRPAVVVLPIITFEDAPPSHWIDNSQNMSSTNVSFRTNVPKPRHDFVPTVATRLMRPQGEEKRKAQLLKRRRKDRTRQIKYEAPVERRHIAWNPSKNVLMPFNSYLNGRPAMNNNYFESFTDIAPHTDIENDDNIEAKYGFSANDTLPELGRIKNKQKRRNLINLLNKLEREVNNIELEGAAKELLDSKIMQIYDKLMNSINEDTTHTQKTYPTEDFLLNHDENIDPMVISPRPDNVGDPFVREIPPTMQSHSKPVQYNEREFGVSNLRHQKSFHPGLSNAGIEVINRIQGFTTKLNNNRNDHGPETTFRKTSYEIDKTGKEKSEYRDPEKFRQMHEEEELKKKIFRTKSFDDYDFLSTERRKFYQEKLDNVKKKSDSKQTLTIPKEFEADRPVRRVRPASYSNSQLRSQYMEDRDQAILLHGF